MLNKTAVLITSLAGLLGCGGNMEGAVTEDMSTGPTASLGGVQAREVSSGSGSQARVFAHPGTPLTLADLQTLKLNVEQGREPWKSGFNQLAGDGRSKLTYTMAGPYAQVSRAPDLNLQPWRNDMTAAWNLSRMWYFTRNADYAKKARDVLLAWATRHVQFSGRESMLDLGDYAYMFVGAADILRGTWDGWTGSDTATMKRYFQNVLIPASNPYGESQFGAANKGALALVAKGLMAIFNDDAATVEQVVYQTRTLAHIGLRSSNDIGMLGDSLRDQGHAYGQLRSLVMLSEALWKQGIDLYSEFDNRLLTAGEYFARVNEGVATPALPFGTTDAYYIADNTNRGWGGGNVALNQIYAAYAIRKGLQAPFIAQRRQWMPVDGNSFMFLKEADSTTSAPPPALSIPDTLSFTAGFSQLDLGSATPAGGATYAAGKWTVTGAGADIWGSGDSGHLAYVALSGDSAIIAKVDMLNNGSVNAKAGVMMRVSLSPGAPRAWMAVTNKGQAEQNMPKLAVYGGTNYGNKVLNIATATPSYWLKLERIGNIITGYLSPDGTNWAATDVGRIDAPVPERLYVGLIVDSAANGTLSSATFSHVQITGGDGRAPISTPSAPAALLAAPGDGVVPLRWQRSFGATSYSVLRATSAGGPYAAIASGVQEASYMDKSVSNGTTYYYAVRASNTAGSSGDSPVDSATPVRVMFNVAAGGVATDSTGDQVNAANAFDLNSATKWLCKGVSCWLRYDLVHTEIVRSYTVVSANDKPERDPRNWRLQGSNDGANWITLDTQVNQRFTGRYELKRYELVSPVAYRYYRLEITANNGDNTFTHLAEIGLLAYKR